MNGKVFPVDAVKLAAKVDYPVVETAVENGKSVWQIAAPAVFMNDAMISKITAAAGSCNAEVATFNSDAAADDFYNKAVCTLTIESDAALPADPAGEIAELRKPTYSMRLLNSFTASSHLLTATLIRSARSAVLWDFIRKYCVS